MSETSLVRPYFVPRGVALESLPPLLQVLLNDLVQPAGACCGVTISRILCTAINIAAPNRTRATMTAAMDSAFPCP